MANITKHKRSRSIVSFLLACSMLTSTFIVDGQSVFALGEAREAVIVNDLEGHGHLEFITAGIEKNTNKQEASEESSSDSGLLTADPAKVTPVQIDENGNVILMDDAGEQSSGNAGSQSIDLGNGFSIELGQDGNIIEPEAVDSTVVSSETVESEIVDAESDVNGKEDSEETMVSEENGSADDFVSEDVSGDTTTDNESENAALTDNVSNVNAVQENTVPTEDKRTFMSGDSIIVKAVPDDGYYLNTIKIVTSNNKSISYNITDENYITFRMPTKDIRISATFSDKKTRITTDNSVVDTQTYILSNIDHKYIDSVDKWEEANIIKVSQTIASRAEFYAAGRSVTFNDMFPDDGIRESLSSAFIHAQETASVLYDVNADSDYYIAYVDTLHDDADVEISDYVFSRINVNGELLTGCHLDVDTGIAYIPKSILADETSGGVQVQLLNTYEKMFEDGNAPELSTNIIIRRDSKIVERGIISSDIYDSDVSAKLPVDYADIKDGRVSISVDINGVTMTDDFYMIDEDSVLTLPVSIINIESIVVDINEVSGVISSTFDSVTGQVVAKGTTWTNSDKITKDTNVTTPGAWRVYAGCYSYLKKGASITSTAGMSNYDALNYDDAGTLAKGYYQYKKSSDGSFFTSIYNFAYNSSAIDKLAKWGAYTGDNGISKSNVWFPYSVTINSGKLSLSGGLNVGLASAQTFRLICVHHSKAVGYSADGTQVGDGVTNPLGEDGTKKWKLVILNVDTAKSRLAIGIVTSAFDGGQAGGGVFTVPYEIPVRVTKGVNDGADRYKMYSYNGSYNKTTDNVTRGIHTYYPYYADGLVLWISKSTSPTKAIAKVVMNNSYTPGSSGNILFNIKSVTSQDDSIHTSGSYIYLPENTSITITEVDYPNNRSGTTGGVDIDSRTLPADSGLRLPYGSDNTTYSINGKTISNPTVAQLKDANLKVVYRTTRTVKGTDGTYVVNNYPIVGSMSLKKTNQLSSASVNGATFRVYMFNYATYSVSMSSRKLYKNGDGSYTRYATIGSSLFDLKYPSSQISGLTGGKYIGYFTIDGTGSTHAYTTATGDDMLISASGSMLTKLPPSSWYLVVETSAPTHYRKSSVVAATYINSVGEHNAHYAFEWGNKTAHTATDGKAFPYTLTNTLSINNITGVTNPVPGGVGSNRDVDYIITDNTSVTSNPIDSETIVYNEFPIHPYGYIEKYFADSSTTPTDTTPRLYGIKFYAFSSESDAYVYANSGYKSGNAPSGTYYTVKTNSEGKGYIAYKGDNSSILTLTSCKNKINELEASSVSEEGKLFNYGDKLYFVEAPKEQQTWTLKKAVKSTNSTSGSVTWTFSSVNKDDIEFSNSVISLTLNSENYASTSAKNAPSLGSIKVEKVFFDENSNKFALGNVDFYVFKDASKAKTYANSTGGTAPSASDAVKIRSSLTMTNTTTCAGYAYANLYDFDSPTSTTRKLKPGTKYYIVEAKLAQQGASTFQAVKHGTRSATSSIVTVAKTDVILSNSVYTVTVEASSTASAQVDATIRNDKKNSKGGLSFLKGAASVNYRITETKNGVPVTVTGIVKNVQLEGVRFALFDSKDKADLFNDMTVSEQTTIFNGGSITKNGVTVKALENVTTDKNGIATSKMNYEEGHRIYFCEYTESVQELNGNKVYLCKNGKRLSDFVSEDSSDTITLSGLFETDFGLFVYNDTSKRSVNIVANKITPYYDSNDVSDIDLDEDGKDEDGDVIYTSTTFNNETYTILINEQDWYGSLYIHKIDTDGRNLSGIKFLIRRIDDSQVTLGKKSTDLDNKIDYFIRDPDPTLLGKGFSMTNLASCVSYVQQTYLTDAFKSSSTGLDYLPTTGFTKSVISLMYKKTNASGVISIRDMEPGYYLVWELPVTNDDTWASAFNNAAAEAYPDVNIESNVHIVRVDGAADSSSDYAKTYVTYGANASNGQYINTKKSELSLKKSSTKPIDNPLYTFEGIEYSLYDITRYVKRSMDYDLEDLDPVAIFTIDKNGNTNSVNICEGHIYAIKETKSNGYFRLNEDKYVFAANSASAMRPDGEGVKYEESVSGSTHTRQYTFFAKDEPRKDPIRIEIYKSDTEGNELQKIDDSYSLEGTKFSVDYYAAYYSAKSELQDVTPDLHEEYFVTKDNATGDYRVVINNTYPCGTVVIREIAPAGSYRITGQTQAGLSVEGRKGPVDEDLMKDDMVIIQISPDGQAIVNSANAGSSVPRFGQFDTLTVRKGNDVIRGNFSVTKKFKRSNGTVVSMPVFDDGENYEPVRLGVALLDGEWDTTFDNGGYETHIVEALEFELDSDGYFNSSTAPSDFWFYGTTDELIRQEHVPTADDLAKGRLPIGQYVLYEVDDGGRNTQFFDPIPFKITEDSPLDATQILDGAKLEAIDVPQPTITTTESDTTTNSHFTTANGTANISDRVTITGLRCGHPSDKYTIVGILVDVTDPSHPKFIPATGDSSKIVSSVLFYNLSSATATDGSYKLVCDVDYSFAYTPGSVTKFVVYEYLLNGEPADSGLSGGTNILSASDVSINSRGVVGFNEQVVMHLYNDNLGNIIAHADMNAASQTGYIPVVETVATNKVTGGKSISRSSSVILDKVTCSGLKTGEQYKLHADLVDGSSGTALTSTSTDVIFTATTSAVVQNVDISFDVTNNDVDSVVVYETLYYNNGTSASPNWVVIAEHKDLTDVKQTVTVSPVSISTSAVDDQTGLRTGVKDASVSITDTVHCDGLIAGETYRLTATLMNNNGSSQLAQTVGESFVAADSVEDHAMHLTFNATNYTGSKVVVYEKLEVKSGSTWTVVATHEDKTDTKQTITFPTVSTVANVAETNSKHVFASQPEVTIIDQVKLTGLLAGETFTVTGELHYVDDGSLVAGVPVATKSFKTSDAGVTYKSSEKAWYINVNFDTFNANILNKRDVVVYETLTYKKGSTTVTLAEHKDKNDANQTVSVYDTSVDTSASDGVSGSKFILPTAESTVVDRISYEGLSPDHTYYIVSHLKDLDDTTGRYIVAITHTNYVRPESENGYIDITLEADLRTRANHTFVVHEYIYLMPDSGDYNVNEDILVAKHEDDTDKNQMVYTRNTSTSLAQYVGETAVKEVPAKGNVTVTDKILMTSTGDAFDLTAMGYLVDKTDGQKVVATGYTTWRTTASNANSNVDFTFNSDDYIDHELVAFEYIYAGTVAENTLYKPTIGTAFVANAITSNSQYNKLISYHADINDTNQTISVVHKVVDAHFSKSDTNNTYIYGAKLRVRNITDNTTLADWTATKTDADHNVELEENKQYVFEEYEAPPGYVVADPQYFRVFEETDATNGKVLVAYYTDTSGNKLGKVDTDSDGTPHFYIADAQLSLLPSAGGFGTLPFVVAGIALAIVSMILYFKRKDEDEE